MLIFKNRIWKRSIFSRVFLTFLLILIPLYILGFNIYNWGTKETQNEIIKVMSGQVMQFNQNLEMDIQRIQMLLYESLYDEDLNNLAIIPDSIDDYEKSRAILRLQARLNAIKNSSPYILNVKAYIPALGISISPLLATENLNQGEFEVFSRAESDSQIFYWEDRLFISVSHPLPKMVRNNLPLFIIGIELSRDGLRNALSQFDNHVGSGAILFETSHDFTIAESKSGSGITNQLRNRINLQKTDDDQTNDQTNERMDINGENYLAIYAKSAQLGMTLCLYLPEAEIFRPIEQYKSWFWLFSFTAIIVIAIYSFMTYTIIHKPIQTLVQSFKRLEKGELNIVIPYDQNNEFGYLFNRFNYMVGELNHLIDQVYKKEVLTQRAELKQLQSQINPHFLYNNFFILSRLIKGEEIENAMIFAKQLGNYFKYITRNAEDDIIFEKEVEHALVYSQIQEMRFSKRMRIEFADLPAKLRNVVVQRLIIQPIIENAFNHGLENKKRNGLLRVYFNSMEEGAVIVVEDNGEELSDSQLKELEDKLENQSASTEYTGMVNVHKRIRLKFGNKSGLTVMRSELGGLKVEIKLIWKDGNSDV